MKKSAYKKMAGIAEEKLPLLLIDILGKDVYKQLYSYYIEILSEAVSGENEKILVFMSRKGYSLYKAFEFLLRCYFDKEKMPYPKFITNDRLIATYARELKSRDIIVSDDSMLFGRTISEFLIKLITKFNINKDRIYVSSFMVNNDLLISENIPTYLEEGDYEWKFSYKPDGEDELINSIRFFPVPRYIKNESEMRGYNVKFMDAIHVASVLYTANMPSFRINDEKLLEKLMNIKKDDGEYRVKSELNFIEAETGSEKIGVNCLSYIFNDNETADSVTDNYLYVRNIRLAYNMELGNILFMPFVIFKKLDSLKKIYDNLTECCDKFLIDENIDQMCASELMNRRLRFLFSLRLGECFMKEEFGINLMAAVKQGKIYFDYNGVFGFAHEEFPDVYKKINFKDLFNNINIVEEQNEEYGDEENELLEILNKEATRYEKKSSKVILSDFFFHSIAVDLPPYRRKCGLPVSLLVQKTIEYCSLDNSPERENFKKALLYELLSLCDRGCAITYSNSKSGDECYVQVGERAITLGNLDEFVWLKRALNRIYQCVKIDKWKEYKDKIKEYVKSYYIIKQTKEESIIYTDKLFEDDCSNILKSVYVTNLDLKSDFFENPSEEYVFFNEFTNKYCLYIISGDENNFLEFLNKFDDYGEYCSGEALVKRIAQYVVGYDERVLTTV